LLVAHDVPAAIEVQANLEERAVHIVWLSGAAINVLLRGFPACLVVRIAEGQTL